MNPSAAARARVVLLKLTWLEIKLLAREPVTLMFSFLFPILVLVLLGGIFGDEQHARAARSPASR